MDNEAVVREGGMLSKKKGHRVRKSPSISVIRGDVVKAICMM